MSDTKKSVLAGRRPGERICSHCGLAFICGHEAGHARCWCADLPPQAIDAAVSGCLCPACLMQRGAAQAREAR